MKTKIQIGIALSLFAVVTAINMNLFQNDMSGDVSLDSIAVMAQASSESGSKQCYPGGYYSGGEGYILQCSDCRIHWTGFTGQGTKRKC